MPACFIALGGNVGDVESAFAAALAQLGEVPGIRVVRVSRSYHTRPVGAAAGGDFSNSAAAIETEREPLDLLGVLKDLERRAGRTAGPAWGPRPLDLDLIFYDQQVIDRDDLHVPHPACWYRRFVLDPLASIAPDVVHPVKHLTVEALRRRLLERPLRVALAGGSPMERRRLAELLSRESDEVLVTEWEGTGPSPEPSILAWLGPEASNAGPQRPPVRTTERAFDALPLAPRLDVSTATDPLAFLRDVLRSSLG